MAKTILRWMMSLALMALLANLSLAAQDTAHKTPTPPKYCNPCLFYGGDFDVNNSAENGLLDGIGSTADGEVYVPFTVPKQQKWQVTGLFVTLISNDLNNAVPAQIKWEIRKHVATGRGGTLLASGITRATIAEVFDCDVPLDVPCAALGTNAIKVSLPSGRYWLAVVPLCEGKGSNCDGDYYDLVDAEDRPPANHYGPLEPWDDSFWSSKSSGAHFKPTWGGPGACQGVGCDRFSAGVLGTK